MAGLPSYGTFTGVDAAQQTTLKYAADIEGLDEEIAVLRLKLRDSLGERPEDFKLMLRGMTLLAKLVSTRYRLSKKAEEDIASSAANLLRGLAVQLFPEASHDP